MGRSFASPYRSTSQHRNSLKRRIEWLKSTLLSHSEQGQLGTALGQARDVADCSPALGDERRRRYHDRKIAQLVVHTPNWWRLLNDPPPDGEVMAIGSSA
jgi:hypothetical protein